MLIAFLATSALMGLFISYIWSSNGFANVCIKMVFSFYTLWAMLLLAGSLWPLVNNGSMRLF
jgi:hypothetical protein